MVKSGKRSNPANTTANPSTPRRGEKTKQTTATKAKESEAKAARQTKLAFPATETNDHSKTATEHSKKRPYQAKISFADALTGKAPLESVPESPDNTTTTQKVPVTPDEGEVNRLKHPTPPTPPPPTPTDPPPPIPTAPNNPITQEQTNPNPTTHDAATNSSDDGNKKPAASKPKKKSKNKKTTSTDTAPEIDSSKIYQAIRYNGTIETPPSDKPFPEFLKLFREYFKIIQDVLGKDIYIAAWDNEQEHAGSFPPLTRPDKIPSSRESMGIYMGTYINPKQDGSRVYLNLRLVTYQTPPVPLHRFGQELADHFSNSPNKMSIYRQPRSCQAAKSECIGWLMYSCKSMNSETFIPALKASLDIPADIAVGIGFRTIAGENGKKPPWNKEDPPAAALHVDIDERFALLYQARAASLWRKNSKQRVPNGVQLRLVPCFTSATGKSMTDVQRSDAKTLAQRQYYFLKEHLKTLPACFFISQLDTPLSPENSMTLRRAMMARAPSKLPTSRLVHNVDASWNLASKYIVTTVVGREVEAQRFLVNLVPEILHRFGDAATKWFTGAALLIFKDVKWNPEKGTTSSAKERNSEEMVKEDVWGLNAKWDELKLKTDSTSFRPDGNALDSQDTPMEVTEEQTRLAGDKSIASFGDVYKRTRDDADAIESEKQAAEAAAMETETTGTQFEFSTDQLEHDRQKALNGPPSSGFSMSTAGKTTPSVRLKLKEAQEQIEELRLQITNQKMAKSGSHSSMDRSHSMTNSNSNSEENPQAPMTKPDEPKLDATEDNRALHAAAFRTARATTQVDPDNMDMDETAPPIHIGSSLSDAATEESAREGPCFKDYEDKEVLIIGSSTSTSSDSDSSTSSSSSSTDSSDDATSDPDSEKTHETDKTSDLVDRLAALRKDSQNPPTTTTPKNSAILDGHSDSHTDPAAPHPSGHDSGLKEDHVPPSNPSGLAGDLAEAAGHGV